VYRHAKAIARATDQIGIVKLDRLLDSAPSMFKLPEGLGDRIGYASSSNEDRKP
jgi:hypothetical protein